MFNKAQKETFIKEYLRSKVIAEISLYAIFKKTEDFEEKLNKDVSKFTKDCNQRKQDDDKNYFKGLTKNALCGIITS